MMDAGNQDRPARWLDGTLAGLHAGMIGVIIMLIFLALASAFYRRTVWTTANLMATVFYGDSALGRGFGVRSLSGLAVYLVVYSILGAIFGSLFGSRLTRMQATAAGILLALGWYLLWFGLLFKTVDPLIPLYTHDRPMLAGHLIYGVLLGRYRDYLRTLRAAALQPARGDAEPPAVVAPVSNESEGPAED